MNLNEKILDLYYIDKLKQKDIAQKLKISKYKVSRTVSKDERYIKDKESRKQKSKQRHKNKTIQYMKEKRERNEISYLFLKAQHEQDCKELSGGKGISNRVYRDWNASAYKYDNRTKSYYLKKGIIAGYDVPKKVNWKSY